MKYQTTMKAIRNNYRTILTVHYCELQNLLRDVQPESYCAGVYGWNCDNYEIDTDCMLSTGYRPIGSNWLPYDIAHVVDTAAGMVPYENHDTLENLRFALADFAKKSISKSELIEYCADLIVKYGRKA